jgi:hypothetical protein
MSACGPRITFQKTLLLWNIVLLIKLVSKEKNGGKNASDQRLFLILQKRQQLL